MKRLSNKEIDRLIEEMEKAASNGDTPEWQKWHKEHSNIGVVLEFPGGEITNPNIAGFMWAWARKNKVYPCAIEKSDRFSANGLEGKVQIATDLGIALIAYRELPEHRRQIKML